MIRKAKLIAAVALADARVREAEQFKENMFVRAPFDGTVISKDAEVGESILPGGMGEASGRGSVVTIADLDHLEVDTDVKEDYISRIQDGQPAEVAVDAVPGKRYQALVRKIIPMGDRARATIKVKVTILNVDDRLFPNMSCTVYFLPKETELDKQDSKKRKIFCAKRAVQSDAQGKFVWAVEADDQIRRIPVTVGRDRDKSIEITQGLEGGERVILGPPDNLQNGQKVRVTD